MTVHYIKGDAAGLNSYVNSPDEKHSSVHYLGVRGEVGGRDLLRFNVLHNSMLCSSFLFPLKSRASLY